MDDEENDLFAINVIWDESSDTEKLPRDHQSEADFLAVKATYQPKIDDGKVRLYLSNQSPSVFNFEGKKEKRKHFDPSSYQRWTRRRRKGGPSSRNKHCCMLWSDFTSLGSLKMLLELWKRLCKGSVIRI